MDQSQHQKFQKIEQRLMHLVLKGAITKQKECEILAHLRASIKHGDTELDSHLNLTEEQLIG